MDDRDGRAIDIAWTGNRRQSALRNYMVLLKFGVGKQKIRFTLDASIIPKKGTNWCMINPCEWP
jgi:hypothetical protein